MPFAAFPLAAFPLAAVLSAVLMPLAIRLAWATSYLDRPEARKLHTHAVALLGGVGVFTAALATWAVAMRVMPHDAAAGEAGYLLGGAAVALALGLWDDRFGMRPSVKMLGQAAAAVMLLASGATPHLGLPEGVEAALLLVALVALMNAVNFLDNMNGMIGGLAPLALAGFATTSLARGANGVAAAQLALAGACAGFLPWNFPKARIFLGDAGSLFLGYSLGASALIAMRGAPSPWALPGAVLVLGYPVFDMLFVVTTRLGERRPLSQGGKDHTNHRLATLLGSPVAAVLTVWSAGGALCACGLAMLRLAAPALTLGLGAAWTLTLLVTGVRLARVPIAPARA